MSRTRKWSGVKGSYAFEAFRNERGGPWLDIRDQSLPQVLKDLLDTVVRVDEVEVVIDFTSSGYSTPAKISGPPERCYEAEGEDVRELAQVALNFDDASLVLPDSTAEKIFDAFQKQIDSADLDYGDDGGY